MHDVYSSHRVFLLLKTKLQKRYLVTLRKSVRTAVSSLLVGALLALMGCGSSKATLRVLNATPNESQIDVSLDSTSFATSVSYGTATGYSSVTSGSRDLEIYPSGVTTAYINATIDLSSGSTYTVMSANVLSNASALLLTDDNSTPSSNTAELRIVNASPGLGTVDVYVVSPGTNLSSVSPTISNFAFEGVSDYKSLTAGTAYEVYFTSPDEKTALVDSGPVTYSNGQIRTMVTLNGNAGGYTLTTLDDLN
jgi:hypothetical protein